MCMHVCTYINKIQDICIHVYALCVYIYMQTQIYNICYIYDQFIAQSGKTLLNELDCHIYSVYTI